MGKRFAIVIGVAAAGVMALGAQTAAAAPKVVKYDTELTITRTGAAFPRLCEVRGQRSASVGDGWSCSSSGPGRIAGSALTE